MSERKYFNIVNWDQYVSNKPGTVPARAFYNGCYFMVPNPTLKETVASLQKQCDANGQWRCRDIFIPELKYNDGANWSA